MGSQDIANAVASNLSNTVKDFSVPTATTDGPTGSGVTIYDNENWSQYLGYFKAIPELKRAINARATWTVGKGYSADPEIQIVLDGFRGWGKDTFNTIIENLIRVYYIGGDGFAEIIRDKDGNLLNLKPLDPGSITIVTDASGMIKEYVQRSKIKGKHQKHFTPDKMLHLARNRMADEIHGDSVVSSMEEIILMRNEAMADWKRVLHRNIDPMLLFKLNTDKKSKIDAIKAKVDAARGKGENMYIPMGSVEVEQITVAPNSTLNALPWIESLNAYFFQEVGVPQIIVGGSGEFIDGAAKTAYLAWQQDIEEEQLFIEEQLGTQIGIAVDFEFPASIENDLISDKQKDGGTQTRPSEVTAGMES